jgi:Saccharopine dehydrogenase NADP binding domain
MPVFPISRVLILGASGQFGTRLSRRLVHLSQLHLFLGGRNEQKLKNLRDELHAIRSDANIHVVAGRIKAPDLLEWLSSHDINLVIHLAGPFQGQDYVIAKTCLQAGVPYIDMADGRKFVAKFSTLDAAAKEKRIALITGASTVPAISSAIVDALLENFSRLEAVDYGICAGAKSGLGPATLQAVLSYCGKPYRVLKNGEASTIFGLARVRHHDFPNPINRRHVVDCDIPDHDLFPARYATLRQMDFGSCLDVPGLARMLSLMSGCVRAGWIKDWNGLSRIVRPFMFATKFLGSSNSGFFMRLEGRDEEGRREKITFEILARGGSGLEIPVTPVILLVKKMLKGEPLSAGAYPCMGLLSLADIQHELSTYRITWEKKRLQ